MGYVGIPVAALFADSGLNVVGLDVDARKVDALNAGEYPIQGKEPGLPDMIKRTVAARRLQATTDYDTIRDADAIIICVQTPFDTERSEPRYDVLRSALTACAPRLCRGALVIVESTIAPGTMEGLVRPTLEKASGLKAGNDFLLGNCPERVMPGKLLHNLRSYGRAVGGIDDATRKAMTTLYAHFVKGELQPMSMLEAEVVKTFENTYRDVEIALANEFAQYCDTVGVDFFRIRDQVNRVESRNLHLPGAGVGGHCIPKDTYLLAYGTKGRFEPKLMLLARKVNDGMPAYMARKVSDAFTTVGRNVKGANIAVLGLSYLGDSDDARNVPTEPFVREMRAGGAIVRVHDPLVETYPGIEVEHDLAKVVKDADAVVLFTAHSPYRAIDLAWLRAQVRTPILVDGRHVWERAAAESAGFNFSAVGQ